MMDRIGCQTYMNQIHKIIIIKLIKQTKTKISSQTAIEVIIPIMLDILGLA